MPLTTVSQGLLSTDAQYTGFKNRIINGAFLFWQRGTSFTPNPVTYGADRFASFKSGASAGDYARSTDVPSGAGFTYSSYFNNADIRQAIELPVVGNAGDYVLGSTWTVSFWAKVGSGTASNVVGLGFADGTSAGNFGRWGSDQSFNVTTTWQYFSRTFTVSNSPVGSNACVLLYFGASPAFYITGIQVEKGSTATSFDIRPYTTELQLCQRYFCKSFPQTVAPANNVAVDQAINGIGGRIQVADVLGFRGQQYFFPVTMRTTPSITMFNPLGASGTGSYFTENNLTQNPASPGPYVTSEYNFGVWQYTGVTVGSTGTLVMVIFHYTASAEL